jgi:hypothetical protein
MGKRSGFPRVLNDLYPTPLPAVLPLIPHLRHLHVFAEPCAGDGDLVRHLESCGLKCGYAGDISRGRDALSASNYGEAIDTIITNPPHARALMHALIKHFIQIAPTWLLIDLDWAATQQAAPCLVHCTDIVVIGRVKWIPGSPYTGKENYGWYRFTSKLQADGPTFHYRAGE